MWKACSADEFHRTLFKYRIREKKHTLVVDLKIVAPLVDHHKRTELPSEIAGGFDGGFFGASGTNESLKLARNYSEKHFCPPWIGDIISKNQTNASQIPAIERDSDDTSWFFRKGILWRTSLPNKMKRLPSCSNQL